MSLSVAKANLMDAMKQFRVRWEKVKDVWDDDTRRQFERDFLDTLEPRIIAAVKGIDHVSELAARVRRECGDDGPERIG